MFTQYISKLKCIYAHKKNIAFPAPLFKKLTNAQQHYVQLTYTTFQPNGQ